MMRSSVPIHLIYRAQKMFEMKMFDCLRSNPGIQYLLSLWQTNVVIRLAKIIINTLNNETIGLNRLGFVE